MGITAAGPPLEVASRASDRGAAAGSLFGLLALVAFSRPASRAETVEEAHVHEGTLSYFAFVDESDVYPDGKVDSGETAFLQLVPALGVVFRYRFAAEVPFDVRGNASISAVVSDGAGWERRVPVAAPRGFTRPDVTVRGTLDLGELAEIVDEMKRLTGSFTTTFSVRVEPSVEVAGRPAVKRLTLRSRPRSAFSRRRQVAVDAPEDGSPVSAKCEPGSVGCLETLSGGLHVSVEKARSLSVLGLAMSLFLLFLAAVALSTRRIDGEHGRFAARFADRMISIARAPDVDSERVTDLADLDSLARIAERYDRVVLHWRRGGEHVYLVDDGSNAYRHRTGPGAEGSSSRTPRHARSPEMSLSLRCPPRRARRKPFALFLGVAATATNVASSRSACRWALRRQPARACLRCVEPDQHHVRGGGGTRTRRSRHGW
jgi:hypothetical protein